MIFPGEDEAMLFENGEPVTIKGVAGIGVFSVGGEMILNNEAVSIGKSVLVLSSLGGTVAFGDPVIFRGDNYAVEHDPLPSADGIFCRIPLSGPILNPPPEIPGQRITTVEGVPLVAVPEVS